MFWIIIIKKSCSVILTHFHCNHGGNRVRLSFLPCNNWGIRVNCTHYYYNRWGIRVNSRYCPCKSRGIGVSWNTYTLQYAESIWVLYLAICRVNLSPLPCNIRSQFESFTLQYAESIWVLYLVWTTMLLFVWGLSLLPIYNNLK